MEALRRIACLCSAALAAAAVGAPTGSADLIARYDAGQQRASGLQSAIHVQSARIQGYQGSLSSLQARLDAIQSSVNVQERQLSQTTGALTAARRRLTALRREARVDRAALAAQLRAQYESPPPTILSVVVDSHGFDALVSGVRDMAMIRRANERTIEAVADARTAVVAQTERLARDAAARRRATAAVVGERDDIVQLKLSIVDRQLAAERARDQDTAALTALRHTLSSEANVLDAAARSAESDPSGGVAVAPRVCIDTPFAPHGGEYGFFPAPGTDYTVNQEPVIAARLDALGLSLRLHLIGVSGYRTPQHSVEVGGFADDPHTKGEASDTPGVEGVPEATLEQFCLTRPFPGPREADHIQEYAP